MSTNSGLRSEVFNARERALSSDWNRAQSFKGRAFAEALAWLYDYQAGSDTSGGAGSIGTTTGAPVRAEVLGGLLVRPQLGSANTLVDRGAVLMVNPDASPNPDDSPTKVVYDLGVADGTQLLLPANASGSTVISIVECSRADVVEEVDSRDIFDPGSGSYLPASVPKVTSSHLTYRVRTVALAGGVTFASGWLPLLVALVPNAVTTWDGVVHMWDVRPLVVDRALPASLTTNCGAIVRQAFSMAHGVGAPSLRGRVEVVGQSGRRLGGDLALDAGDVAIDLSSSTVLSAAGAPNTCWHLYLAEPFGLPRWCRYTSVASGARLPGRLKGMPIVQVGSTQPPQPVTNANVVGLIGPTGLGFSGTIVAPGGTMVAVAGGSFDGAGAFVLNFNGDGEVQWQQTGLTKAASASTSGTASWVMSPGDDYPANARAVWVKITCSYSANATFSQLGTTSVAITDGGGGIIFLHQQIISSISGQPYVFVATVKLPVHEVYPSSPSLVVPTIIAGHGGANAGYGGAPNVSLLTVLGWEIR